MASQEKPPVVFHAMKQQSPQQPFNLPLSLLRHGAALIGFGLLFGCIVPLTPYPRLALTAHMQFAIEGTMVAAAGASLNSTPFRSSNKKVVDNLGRRGINVVYYGIVGIWVTLLSEAANAWWGTRWVLPIAHEAAGLLGAGAGPAKYWMEMVVAVAHYPLAVPLALVWPTITMALFATD
ncbi:hypothetical protein B0T14DRAFT_545115 [Immersiella caudata]|uniref:Uncharacterized protein n=1 Tax=Immersiella caudata TaxID=314043 RepID=A0AA39WXZ8_9PEZI|nr:hypothetical protein B0T14DRAFT_545115 [Immersiella caudata]